MMKNFNCTSLDTISKLDKVTVDSKSDRYDLTGSEFAEKLAGIVFRKYVSGESITIWREYDYALGIFKVTKVRYSNGFIERFEY